MNKAHRFWSGMLLLLLAGISLPASATCTKKDSYAAGYDRNGAGIGLGRINVTSNYLQPVGTPLGSSIVNFGSIGGYKQGPDTVLYECDVGDKDKIFEVFATNGDDRVGGYWDLGAQDGYPNYFATWFPYVGIRLTHINSGKVFTRYWQSSPITTYATSANGNKIQIRVKDFSTVQADLIKISSKPPSLGSGSNYCAGYGTGGMAPTTGSSNYNCDQPSGYTTFRGPGLELLSAPNDGDDSNTHILGWPAYWIAMSMWTSPQSSVNYTATCVARNVTPLVILPPITVQQLTTGQTSQAQFTINIECDNNATSGVSTNNTALGLQVPADSYAAAQSLGLVNGSGGVKYLLSTGYGTDSSIATGVGIELSNAVTGTSMNFIGANTCTAVNCPTGNPTGNDAGWYPVRNGANNNGSNQSGYTNYLIQLTATLARLPGQTVTAGKVDAKAYVWVKVQ
ncbi:MAG: fimbrial protein [Enterobacteriaceae bacterium]|nr:fimbrial protein [Enterobacteriaceae bacterium]